MRRMLVAILVLIGLGTAQACVSDDEPWSGTIGDSTVTCCARHNTRGEGRTSYLDDVTLYCRPGARHTIFLYVHSIPEGLPGPPPTAAIADPAVLCRSGPRWTRPRRLGKAPQPPPLVGCRCPIAVSTLEGDFDLRGGVGTTTGITGTASCPNRTIGVALRQSSP